MGVRRDRPQGVSIGPGGSGGGGSVACRRPDSWREGSVVASGTRVFAVYVRRGFCAPTQSRWTFRSVFWVLG